MGNEPRDRHASDDATAQAERDLLAAALADLSEPVVVIGIDLRVMHVNQAAAQLLSIAPTEAAGLACAEVLGCAESDGHAAMQYLLSRAPGATYTLGTAQLRCTLSLVRHESGTVGGMVAAVHARAQQASPIRADEFSLRDFVGRSAGVRKIADTVRRLANSDASVLITGESGTGKELIARALHGTSRRKDRPFVALNCAAIPMELAESELFGHVRGAFTGALRDRKGAVEEAKGGTFLLDEVGELPVALQPKLLRLLQERTFQAVGDTRERTADIRVIAATNADLQRAVEEGRFRSDLFYRLRVVPIVVPPLRERVEDIEPLASILLARRSLAAGRIPMRLSGYVIQILERHAWPGNVRELVNVLDYVIALCPDEVVGVEHLPPDLLGAPAGSAGSRGRYAASVDGSAESATIRAALERNGFHRLRTAQELGMDRVTLYRKMKEYGLDLPRGKGR
jgi:two-component system, NtrC family, response regulator HydG